MGNVTKTKRTETVGMGLIEAILHHPYSEKDTVHVELFDGVDFLVGIECLDFENANALMDALVKHTGGKNG